MEVKISAMLTEKELNDCLKEDIENMADNNIVDEIAYYLYEYAKGSEDE